MATKQVQIDPAHSDITFTVRHMVIARVHGRFTRWQGTLWLDEEDLTQSRVEIAIEAASIDTNEPKRDAHLRSVDFLDGQTYPKITFKSTGVEVKGKALKIAGDFTLRGVTRPITVTAELLGHAKDPWGNEKVAFTGHTTIEREAYGAKWNQALEAGGWLVGKEVQVDFELQAIAATAVNAA